MNMLFMLILFVGLPLFLTIRGGTEGSAMPKESGDPGLPTVTLTVMYDNNPSEQGLETAWGFSCLVEGAEQTLFFDAGGDGAVLVHNMERLGIRPADIDLVMLSHIHGDHVGGLPAFLAANHDVSLYIPASFSARFSEQVERAGAHVVNVRDAAQICDHVYSSGEVGRQIREHALILRTEQGLIVITGCAHPGIVKIVQKAKSLLNEDVLLVMGGFHVGGHGPRKLEQIVSDFRTLGVHYVGPCHCSGDAARQVFQKEYQDHFIPVGAGSVLTLHDLTHKK